MSPSVEGTSRPMDLDFGRRYISVDGCRCRSKVHLGRWMVTLVESTSWLIDVDIGRTYMVLQATGPGLKEVHMIPRPIIIFPQPKIVFPGLKAFLQLNPFQVSILKTIY